MLMNVFEGILIPFVGTTLGAACVFFMRKTLSKLLQRALAGFAAGIMVAASIWSLLIPAIKQSENMGTLSFVPAVVGFWIGILFLLALDHLIPHLHVGSDQTEGPKSKLGRTTMMVLAVTFESSFGDKFMYQHAMKAPDEMRELHKQFYAYMKRMKKCGCKAKRYSDWRKKHEK